MEPALYTIEKKICEKEPEIPFLFSRLVVTSFSGLFLAHFLPESNFRVNIQQFLLILSNNVAARQIFAKMPGAGANATQSDDMIIEEESGDLSLLYTSMYWSGHNRQTGMRRDLAAMLHHSFFPRRWPYIEFFPVPVVRETGSVTKTETGIIT